MPSLTYFDPYFGAQNGPGAPRSLLQYRGNKVAPLSATSSASPLLGRQDGVNEGSAAPTSSSLPPRTPLLTRIANAVEFGEHDTLEGVSLFLLPSSNPLRIFLAKVRDCQTGK